MTEEMAQRVLEQIRTISASQGKFVEPEIERYLVSWSTMEFGYAVRGIFIHEPLTPPAGRVFDIREPAQLDELLREGCTHSFRISMTSDETLAIVCGVCHRGWETPYSTIIQMVREKFPMSKERLW